MKRWKTVRSIARMRRRVALAATLTAGASLADAELLLRDAALITAHDASTTYMPEPPAWNVAAKEVVAFAKTQPDGGFARLLDCGARALDLRTKVDARSGQVVMHHGAIEVNTTLENSLDDVASWSAKHPGELVLLYFSHFADSAARKMSKEVLLARKIEMYDEDTTDFNQLTYDQARTQGPVVAVFDSVVENFDKSIVCETLEYRCDSSKTQHIPFQRLNAYLDKTSASNRHVTASLSMLQAHWQSNAETISLGVLRGSSILKQVEGSRVNDRVADEIRAKRFPHINLLEVDNVCDGGLKILKALQDRREDGIAQ